VLSVNRRVFLTALAAAVGSPLRAYAQDAAKRRRIAMLERTSIAINAANVESFRQRLRELGYVDGSGFIVDYRSVDGVDERYSSLAADLVASSPTRS
jgi:putative tryptophan/tyrosine transport system substrate-binding protein